MNSKLLGSALLVTGSCIGAGMLAMPIVAGILGFFPAIALMLVVWLYLLISGFMLLKLISQYPHEKDVNLITLANDSFGLKGQFIIGFLFIFLFYSLMVAYIDKGGDLLALFLKKISSPFFVQQTSSYLLTFFSLLMIGLGAKVVDIFNRLGVFILCAAYLSIISIGIPLVDTKYLYYFDSSAVLFLIPYLVVSFGYHNMVATTYKYLNFSIVDTKKAIVLGTTLAFVIYTVWIFVEIGVVPLRDGISLIAAYHKSEIATEPLSRISKHSLSIFAQVFAFFSILTSIFGQGLSMVDFYKDIHIFKKTNRYLLSALIFLPSFIFAKLYPEIFFIALEIAGAIAATLLFGFLPAYMIYMRQENKNFNLNNCGLLIFAGCALVISILEFLEKIGLINLTPKILDIISHF